MGRGLLGDFGTSLNDFTLLQKVEEEKTSLITVADPL